ncbi:hypothetical protein H4R20_003550 [Coemansia guatemalensis]|uniref:P-loop containing nucleoside triphosphate hydrolase protein n=1 Tax=Coemansia guatemalensis TaxID=2761395 RepID=A0A9W8LTM0_9FUNG|nr:hypothetical protein H4R20_003550 [Coemansia guatemalensis]
MGVDVVRLGAKPVSIIRLGTWEHDSIERYLLFDAVVPVLVAAVVRWLSSRASINASRRMYTGPRLCGSDNLLEWAAVSAVAVRQLSAYLASTRNQYYGLFGHMVFAFVVANLCTAITQTYWSFFVPEQWNTPMWGTGVSAESALLEIRLVINTAATLLLLVVRKLPKPGSTDDTPLTSFEETEQLLDQELVDSSTHVRQRRLSTNLVTRRPSPEIGNSILSNALFCWVGELITLVQRRRPQIEDLCDPPHKYSLDASWKRYCNSAQRRDSLVRQLVTAFRYEILAQVVLNPLSVALDYMQPVLIQQLLRFIACYSNDPSIGLRYGFFLAIAMLFSSLAATAVQQQQDWGARTLLVHIRNTLVALLTRKTMRRRTKGPAVSNGLSRGHGASDASEGRAYNILSSDIQRMSNLIKLVRASMLMPIQLLIGAYYMYSLLGVAGILGTLILILAVFMTRRLIARAKRIEVKLGKINDHRLATINEVVRGIVSVKLFGWGSRFVDLIGRRRNSQLVMLWKRAKVRSLINLCTLGSLPFVSFATFLVYSLQHILDAESIFTAIAVFKIIQRSVESMPLLIADSTSFYVSFRRIETYLTQQEVQPLETRAAPDVAQDVVGFENATLLWNGSAHSDEPLGEETFGLRDLDVQFPCGGLTLIGGPTGSGKSSLLAALVGEMELVEGHVRLPVAPDTDYQLLGSLSSTVIDNIAYVPQEPWLRNATIRDNILFGEPFHHERYEHVLHMCALLADLHTFVAGDMTEIGERGITLSGGQRQRVALARAIYSQRKILLIDDCLSAVDAHTASHILHKCLLSANELMSGRTCLLVTHHMAMCLPHCDFVVLMQGGRIAFQGTSAEALVAMSGKQITGLDATTPKSSPDKLPEQHEEDVVIRTDHTPSSDVDGDADLSYGDPSSRINSSVSMANDVALVHGKLVQEEVRSHGLIKLKTWKMYFAPCGGWKFVLACLGCIGATQFLAMYKDYYLAKRLGSEEGTGTSYILPESPASVMSWLVVYLSFGVLSAIISSLALLLTYSGSLKASATLHELLISSIVNAMPRFLDTTPIGRIMARFTRDIQAVDDEIMLGLNNIMRPLISLTITLITISSVVPPFAIVGLLVLALYAHFTWRFIKALRNSKRLESTTFAPIISLYSEMIPGSDLIRAFAMESAYMSEMEQRYSAFLSADFSRRSMSRWMRIRIGIVSSFVTFITAWFILVNIDTISSGLAGFILIYTVNFWADSTVIVRKYGDLELSLNSVERIHQYLDIDHEAPSQMPSDGALAPGWPNTGTLDVHGLVAGYTERMSVLHGLSFTVGHGKKIGVVGRTGAGKSSLSLALLRMIEASSGSIVLDGVDIANVGLERLRQSITIIPQNPILFNGTIRFNLDPFGDYSDPLLLEALQRTLLLKGLPADENSSVAAFGSLDDLIADGGQNLSLGQRQLVALARALVRRSRLVIMDEATASVDFETDESMQRAIRGVEFSDSTLLCIAHRLRTIVDYDYVLVLDEGNVVEFDTPARLIQQKDGYFYRLCENSNEFEMLQALAYRSIQD